MDSVKFVPPGGHRACLSCSAAKAKCVFSDDAEGGDGLGLGFGDGSDFINTSSGDLSAAASPSASSSAAGQLEGTPAVPRCQRCERLNRDCLLPTRPRKKRRVGSLKPGTSRSAIMVTAPQPASAPTLIAGRSGDAGGRVISFPAAMAKSSAAAATAGGHLSATPSSPASRIPSLSKLPTPVGSSSAMHRGPGSSQPPPKRSPLITPQFTLQPASAPTAPSPLLLQQQYPKGRPPKRAGAFGGTATSSSTSSIPAAPRPAPGATPISISAPTPSIGSPEGSTATADFSRLNPYGTSTAASTSAAPTRQSPQLASSPTPASQNAHQVLINSVFRMDEREAEELLRFYRDAYSRFNPYMEPPAPGMKVSELQAQKPLVWLSIVFVTSFHDFERQNRLGKAIIFYLTDQVFQNNAKSLDLLQGLLIFLNWFIAQNFVLPQFTNLIHIAMALVTDLGLNKLEFSKTASRSPLDRYVAKTIHGPGLRAPDEGHTLDERRALAGGYCLSHAMSDSIIMVTPLHFTLQLEDTCRFFEVAYAQKSASAPATAGVTADYHLAISVRLYYLIARVLQVQRDADLAGGRFVIPWRTHIDNFVTELNRLWEALPRETQSDFKIQLLYYTAEVYIYELSLSTSTTPFKTYGTPSGDSDDGTVDKDMPIKCYMAVKSFFDIYLTLPVSLYHQFPVTLFTQLVHADLTLAKLTAYFRGNTRPEGVPEGVTLPAFTDTIEAVASRFQRVRTVPHPLGYTVRNIIYDAFAARLRSFKVLDLASHRKAAKAAAAAARNRQKTPNPQASSRAHAAHTPAARVPSASRTPPTSSGVMSIDKLIGNVPVGNAPEAMNTDPDGPYASVEMDVETESMHGETPDRSRGRTADTESVAASEMDMVEMSTSDEEQAEWWAWFGGFQSSLFGQPPGSTTAGGSVSGASVAGGQGEDASRETPRRPRGPGSVGSIDSLLNNNDQEPNLDAYIQQQKQ